MSKEYAMNPWPPTQVPDLDTAVDRIDGHPIPAVPGPDPFIIKIREARQRLWLLVSKWERLGEHDESYRTAAADLREILEAAE